MVPDEGVDGLFPADLKNRLYVEIPVASGRMGRLTDSMALIISPFSTNSAIISEGAHQWERNAALAEFATFSKIGGRLGGRQRVYDRSTRKEDPLLVAR